MDMTAERGAADTRWAYIVLLLFAGICAAAQVGKVPPAIPVLRDDLHFGLVAAGWVISMFSVIGALSGAALGSITDRFGGRRVTVIGFVVMATASALGSTADSAGALIASRALEGMAFIVVVISIPGLLSASAKPEHQRIVPSLWGVYMPLGMTFALTLTPILVAIVGWRVVWQLNAVLLILFALALALIEPPTVAQGSRGALSLSSLRRTVSHPSALLLGLAFMGYTFQHLSVIGFLPTILQGLGIDAHTAGLLAAGAVLANGLGNLVVPWLLSRHVPAWRMIAIAAVVMGLTGFGIFASHLPTVTRYVLTVIFSGVGGLLPASIFSIVPSVAREANTGATTQGLAVQSSHIGQLLGPPAIASIAAMAGGWGWSPLVLAPAALLSLFAALKLRGASAAATAD
jgi:MFS family permease